jgi:hypothetical protein
MRRALAAIIVMTLASRAWARSEKTLAYAREQAWPAAVRFLAVDERVKVTDKDGDAGYVIFELVDDGKTYRGSLEVIAVGRGTKVVVTIEDRPPWLEVAMLQRLERKLRAELGSPQPPPAPKAEPKPADPKPAEPRPAPPKPDDGGPPISPTP